ncbi:hypothetical protein ABZ085_25210, partial [Streptomyces albidoflavus]
DHGGRQPGLLRRLPHHRPLRWLAGEPSRTDRTAATRPWYTNLLEGVDRADQAAGPRPVRPATE